MYIKERTESAAYLSGFLAAKATGDNITVALEQHKCANVKLKS